jgi:excisionase family DNA binding protein
MGSAMHTPSSAARATGVTKSTIYRAIKTGRLPAHQLHNGKYAIYPADLRCVFPSAPPVPRAAGVASPNSASFPVWDVG